MTDYELVLGKRALPLELMAERKLRSVREPEFVSKRWEHWVLVWKRHLS
jgi:hypothetical protein